MITAQRLRGNADPIIMNPYSRTMQYGPTEQYLRTTRASMDMPNLEVRRLNGLGDGMGSVPSWVPWAVGGLVLGLAGGYGVYRMRKGKRK